MFHHTDDIPEPVERLRRRDLVAAISARLAIGHDQAAGLMDAIETIIELEAGSHGRFALLPRVGSVETRPGGFPGLAPLTWLDTTEPLIVFSTMIATEASIAVDDVEIALAVITKMIETAPVDAAVYVPGWGYHGDDEALARVVREQTRELVEHYREHPTTTWLLQCNPDKWDVFAAINETGELPWSWSVNRYLDQIGEGDRVVFWLSGKQAGVYAVGEVLGPPERGEVDTDHIDGSAPHKWEWFIPIAMDIDLFDEPISRTELRTDPRFADQHIIRAPWAANPHPLGHDGFLAILDRIGSASG